MSEFTKGTWTWINTNTGIQRAGRLFADEYLVLDSEEGIYYSNQADMRLIALSPSLYKALNDLLNDCINFNEGNSNWALEQASEVLKAAKGDV